MNNIGLLIKMSRIQQNMKQVTLAKGICSTSYLSKIENNQTVPSDDVLDLLLKRLDINFQTTTIKTEEDLLKKLYSLYKEAISERKPSILKDKIMEFNDENILFKDSKNYYLYHLYTQRIKLIIDPLNDDHGKQVLALLQMKTNFDSRQMFIFSVNCALYYYYKSNFKKSVELIEEALEILSNFHIENWEIADFYNIISTTYLVNNQLLNTIEYANKSLKIYKDLLIFNRVINCYIIIGIAHKRNMNYNQAEENFLTAMKIANELKINEQDSIIYSNLGSLMSVKGISNLAIKYFFNGLETSKTIESKITTIFSIVQEYFKLNNYSEVISWSEKGLDIIKEKDSNTLLSFTYHFDLYLAISKKSTNQEQKLIETIEFFESVEDFRHVHKYSILLAEYYSNLRKYKNSSKYYQLANINLYKLKKIHSWEDL